MQPKLSLYQKENLRVQKEKQGMSPYEPSDRPSMYQFCELLVPKWCLSSSSPIPEENPVLTSAGDHM
jgi:hypothetical protein